MKIQVKNFQSIKKAEVEVKGLTVITGPNNIGKSALARAISGVFSNLKGNSFVRKGESHCEVEVEFEDGNHVIWEKGKKKNDYTINGKHISKAGFSAPKELEPMKITPIEVDGREVWPQIAKQFDQIFLLNMPPSAISSALSNVENIRKIEKASSHARKDIRDLKSRIKIKREDQDISEKKLQCFVGFDFNQIRNIEDTKKQIQEIKDKLSQLDALLKKRNKAKKEIAVLSEAEINIPTEDFTPYMKIPELILLKKKRNIAYILKSCISVTMRGFYLPEVRSTIDTERRLNEIEALSSRRNKVNLLFLEHQIKRVYIPSDISIPLDISKQGEKRKKLIFGLKLATKEVKEITNQLEKIGREGICPLCLRSEDQCQD